MSSSTTRKAERKTDFHSSHLARSMYIQKHGADGSHFETLPKIQYVKLWRKSTRWIMGNRGWSSRNECIVGSGKESNIKLLVIIGRGTLIIYVSKH
jgi:hypothetical protein